MRSTVVTDLELEPTQWHDGRLMSLEIAPADEGCNVHLVVAIYADLVHAPNRHELSIRFTGVRELCTSLNGPEVADNYACGNIAFARPNDTDTAVDLGIYLVGGYVRVLADDYVVKRR
jgi:hypothetical protein